jgi:hypothetical protein
MKHCKKREGATKKRKTKPTTQTTTKVPFQTTNENKNNTCETCDPTNLEMSYIFNNTPQRKVPWLTANREEERVHLLLAIVVTAPVFQLDMS